MSLEELWACKEELEECEAKLEEESSRLSSCLDFRDDLDMLMERIRDLPDELADFLLDLYEADVDREDIKRLVEGVLDKYGVNWKGELIRKRFGSYYDEREAEGLKRWVDTYAEQASRDEIESELASCRELLEGCRERLGSTKAEADECEAITEERNEVARKLLEELPERLASEVIDYLEDMGIDARDDEEDIRDFIEEFIRMPE